MFRATNPCPDEMNASDYSVPKERRNKPFPGVAISLSIFFGFFVTAQLIGSTYSCTPVVNVYYWGGLLSLPVLFAVPFVCAPKLHVVLRSGLGMLNVGLGVVTWAWAYDAARMTFMCRLF